MNEPNKTQSTREEEFFKRRRRRSIVLALCLGALVLIFYAITVVNLGPDVFVREL